jgi:hypothetical protein
MQKFRVHLLLGTDYRFQLTLGITSIAYKRSSDLPPRMGIQFFSAKDYFVLISDSVVSKVNSCEQISWSDPEASKMKGRFNSAFLAPASFRNWYNKNGSLFLLY